MTLVSDSYKPIAPDRGPGYVCNCELGSPKPHLVKIDAKLHHSSCIIYQRLTSGDYTEDVDIFYE